MAAPLTKKIVDLLRERVGADDPGMTSAEIDAELGLDNLKKVQATMAYLRNQTRQVTATQESEGSVLRFKLASPADEGGQAPEAGPPEAPPAPPDDSTVEAEPSVAEPTHKTCPFCGNDDLWFEAVGDAQGFIRCQSCDACGPLVEVTPEMAAWATWDRRKPTQLVPA